MTTWQLRQDVTTTTTMWTMHCLTQITSWWHTLALPSPSPLPPSPHLGLLCIDDMDDTHMWWWQHTLAMLFDHIMMMCLHLRLTHTHTLAISPFATTMCDYCCLSYIAMVQWHDCNNLDNTTKWQPRQDAMIMMWITHCLTQTMSQWHTLTHPRPCPPLLTQACSLLIMQMTCPCHIVQPCCNDIHQENPPSDNWVKF